VVRTLTENGFTNIKALLGGFQAWEEAGFPTEPKEAPAGRAVKAKMKRAARKG
jgi:3-mercaptopyruvate sulfurtransferase SseA